MHARPGRHSQVSAQPCGLLLGERAGGPGVGPLVGDLAAGRCPERVAACNAEQRLAERPCRVPPFVAWQGSGGLPCLPVGGKVVVSMIASMTREKIAISLPEEQVAAARQAVAEGRAASVSAYISQALARRSAEEEMAEMIAEIYAQSGEPTEEDRAWARRVLGVES